MNQEDIIRMATNEYGIYAFTAESLAEFATIIAAAERNKLAAWMIQRGFATGHGDTIKDLLKELEWQIDERISNEREACAKVCEDIPLPKDSKALTHLPTIERCATAIRARGEK